MLCLNVQCECLDQLGTGGQTLASMAFCPPLSSSSSFPSPLSHCLTVQPWLAPNMQCTQLLPLHLCVTNTLFREVDTFPYKLAFFQPSDVPITSSWSCIDSHMDFVSVCQFVDCLDSLQVRESIPWFMSTTHVCRPAWVSILLWSPIELGNAAGDSCHSRASGNSGPSPRFQTPQDSKSQSQTRSPGFTHSVRIPG